MYGECEGSHPLYEAYTFCRSPDGEESAGSEQGFTQAVAQAARNRYRPNIVDEEVPPVVRRIIVRQCWLQRAFASWNRMWSGPRSPHLARADVCPSPFARRRSCGLIPSSVMSGRKAR